MTGQLLFSVGNGLMGDDGAAVLLARMLQQAPLPGWQVLNGGSAPENLLHQVRELAPRRVLIVDCSDMDLPPGEIRRIPDDLLSNPFLFSTHTLPLTFLIESLREFVPQVELLGIQPEVVAFGFPMSAAVEKAVTQIYNALRDDRTDWLLLSPENDPLSLPGW